MNVCTEKNILTAANTFKKPNTARMPRNFSVYAVVQKDGFLEEVFNKNLVATKTLDNGVFIEITHDDIRTGTLFYMFT